MRYANIYIYIFVIHRGFFQQPRDASPPGQDAFPQLGRQIAVYPHYSLQIQKNFCKFGCVYNQLAEVFMLYLYVALIRG